MGATMSWDFLRIPNADGTFSIRKSERLSAGSPLGQPTRFTVVGASCPVEPPGNMSERELNDWLSTLRDAGYEVEGL